MNYVFLKKALKESGWNIGEREARWERFSS